MILNNESNKGSYVYMGLTKEVKTLEDKYQDKLEIHLEPYTEITVNVEKVLDAIMNGAALTEARLPYDNLKKNNFKLYALYVHRGVTSICPVDANRVTSLCPLRVNAEGYIELSGHSLGIDVNAKQIESMCADGVLAGYVKVIA